jgi:hypothetical protein
MKIRSSWIRLTTLMTLITMMFISIRPTGSRAFNHIPSGLVSDGNLLLQPSTQKEFNFGERAGATAGRAIARGDFNGDGYSDLVIGSPGEGAPDLVITDGNGVADGSSIGVGMVSLYPGSPNGRLVERNRIYGEGYTAFGQALAAGDFNGDGATDLAVGRPNYGYTLSDTDYPYPDGSGAVQIFYGVRNFGLSESRGQLWTQDSTGIRGAAEAQDKFGSVLAVGDFNNDGYSDLVIGIPNEDEAAGAVAVLYGSRNGLTANGNQLWDQDGTQGSEFNLRGTSEKKDKFGASLAAGDFNHDGFDDLAVGVPGENLGSHPDAGAVAVIYGGSSGLTNVNNQFWDQNGTEGPEFNLRGGCEKLDEFGTALAAGDFNDDGFDDLAVGIPGESIDGHDRAGAVAVIYGAAQGLTQNGNQLWDQNGSEDPDVYNLRGGCEEFDEFGTALTAGDFNADGKCDLAIGIPGEGIGNILSAGAVAVIYGSSQGLTNNGNQLWDQNGSEDPDLFNLEGGCENSDNFGETLVSGDFNGDGRDDLAVGVTGEDEKTGAVAVIFGSGNRRPTANANGPYTGSDCTPLILDASHSSDPDGDELQFAWDLDGDGVFGETGASAMRGDEVGAHPTFRPNNLTFVDGRAIALVLLRVSDVDGLENFDNALITINDPPPVITCGGNITKSTDPDGCSALVQLSAAAATDNCGGVVVTGIRSDHQPLSAAYPKGVTTVTWNATDSVGNNATCLQTIEVVDTQKPVLVPVAEVSRSTDPGKCSANINIVAPTASDNCDGVSVTGVRDDSQVLSAPYPKGRTKITWTAKDSSGNTDSVQQTVSVNDTEKPTISCPVDINRNTDPGKCSATVSISMPSVADNCPGATVSGVRSDKQALTADYPKGATLINWTAMDASGNIAACQQTINVRDAQLPVINQPADMTLATAAGQCSAPVTFQITASDIARTSE